MICNAKQKYYEQLVKTINSTEINILHVSNRSITGYYSHFIRLGAFLKGRDNKVTHTALLYKYGHDPRICEALITTGDFNHAGFYDAYFRGFEGRVWLETIPAKITDKYRSEIIRKIEHEYNGLPYSRKKAYLAFIDFLKPQKDNDNKVYCTDKALDIIEMMLGEEVVCNNAEVTPAELFNLSLYRRFKGDKRLIIDTYKSSWEEMLKRLPKT